MAGDTYRLRVGRRRRRRDITERKAAEELRTRTANLELLDELLTRAPELWRPSRRVRADSSGRAASNDARCVVLLAPLSDGLHALRLARSGFLLGSPKITENSGRRIFLTPNREHGISMISARLTD